MTTSWWKTPAAVITAAVLVTGGAGAAVAATLTGDEAVPTPRQPTSSEGRPKPSGSARPDGRAAGRGHDQDGGGQGRAHGHLRVRDQWVTKGKDGSYVTHNLVRGTVTAVDGSTLRVTSLDGVAQAWAVTGETKVMSHTKGQKGGTQGALSDVVVGAEVAVSGPGTTTLSAQRVVIVKS